MYTLVVLALVAAAHALSPLPRVHGRLGDAGPNLVIKTCLPSSSPFSAYQQWEFGPNQEIRLVATYGCIDVEDYSTDDQANVYTWTPCHPEV